MAKHKVSVEKADSELAALAGVPKGSSVVVVKKKRKKRRGLFDVSPKKAGKHFGKAVTSMRKAMGF